MNTEFPIEAVRSHFPALEREHGDALVAYFDGPGGTQVPTEVVGAMSDYLLHHNANTHWAYPSSAETDAIIAGGRLAMADLVNGAPDEIAFGANMTTLTYHLARGLSVKWGPGDEVVVTELDHHANVGPWQRLAQERGVAVRTVKMIPETGQLDWDDMAKAITRRTKIVAVGAASNALGTINDVARAASMAREVGALIFVDAVHFAPHALVDVQALECDFLACSAYKFYGPHIGILWGRRDRLGEIDFPKLIPAPDTPPEVAETGTQNHEGIAGATAAVDFLASLGKGDARRRKLESAFYALHDRGSALFAKLWEGLAGISGVTLFGPPPGGPRTPTVGFAIEGASPHEVCRRLAERGVFASSGDFYAATVVERLGHPEGLVRAGCACYTTEEEVDRLIEGVRQIQHSQ